MSRIPPFSVAGSQDSEVRRGWGAQGHLSPHLGPAPTPRGPQLARHPPRKGEISGVQMGTDGRKLAIICNLARRAGTESP